MTLFLHLLSEYLSLGVTAGILFWSAGRLDWWPGWALISVWAVWFAVTDLVLFRRHPDLVSERLYPPRESNRMDRLLVSLLRLFQLARYIVAGLDVRYGWSAGFPVSLQIVSVILCVPALALFAWAMASNRFFSQILRIQSDRGHRVIEGGPYRFVRHPGYAAMILFEFALSALLGSWWAIGVALICTVVLVVRTAYEDRVLCTELEGYAGYCAKVKYRLFPGVY